MIQSFIDTNIGHVDDAIEGYYNTNPRILIFHIGAVIFPNIDRHLVEAQRVLS